MNAVKVIKVSVCMLVMCVICSAVLFAQANSENMPILQTKIKTLAAFKNGLGFVHRLGETPLEKGYAEIELCPAAALGTYWVSNSDPRYPLDELLSFKKTVAISIESVNVQEILKANIGKIMVVYVNSNDPKTASYTGKLISFPDARTPENSPPELFSSSSRSIAASRLLLLEIESNGKKSTVAINPDTVNRLEIIGDIKTTTEQKVEKGAARVHIKDNPGKAQLSVAYLQKGFNWSPSYLINMLKDNEVSITMEAILANDVEDIENADVSFVVGYPNFAYANAITPLALNQAVGAFIQSLSRVENERANVMAGTGMMTQSVMSNISYSDYSPSREWRPEQLYNVANNLSGESNEDLYYYKQKNVTLKKGERARYTVLSGNVPCEHIYMLDVPDVSETRNSSTNTDRNKDQYQVWHSLRLKNTLDIPWTTAPALVVKESLPLAQNMLKYTAAKSKTTLKMTVATDIQAQQEQSEESRTRIIIRGSEYSNITVTGKIVLTNYKSKTVKMNILKSINGKVANAGTGESRTIARSLNGLNPTSEIEWEFEIESGKTVELPYTYKVIM